MACLLSHRRKLLRSLMRTAWRKQPCNNEQKSRDTEQHDRRRSVVPEPFRAVLEAAV